MDPSVLRRQMERNLHDPKHLCVEDMLALPELLAPGSPHELFTNDTSAFSRQGLMKVLREEGRGQPQFVDMRHIHTRLATLDSWPFPSKRRELAAAGFFSREQGLAQELHCYQCGVGLRGWSATSDPWLRHAQVNHYCQHINRFAVRSIVLCAEDTPVVVRLYRHLSLPSGSPCRPSPRRHSDVIRR